MGNERRERIIKALNDLCLKDLTGIRCGNVLQLTISDFRMKWPGALKAFFTNLDQAILKFDYIVQGQGSILFLYMSNQFKNPHIYTKMQRIADLTEEHIELHAIKKKKINRYIGKTYLIFVWAVQMSKIGLGFWECMYLALFLFVAYTETLLVHSKVAGYTIKLVASIHDVRLEDNMIIQFFNQRGVDTVALVHAMFRLPWEKFDYKCSASKYFMVADSKMYSEAIAMGMDASRLIKVCLPQYIKQERKEVIYREEKGVFGVCLSHPDEMDNNYLLLKSADKLAEVEKKKYYIKVHPSDKKENYEKYCQKGRCIGIWDARKDMEIFLKGIDFAVVGARSSMFLDMLYQGTVAFRGVSNEVKDVYSDIEYWKFKNYAELLHEYKQCQNVDYMNMALKAIEEKYFQYCSNYNSYIEFFQKYS